MKSTPTEQAGATGSYRYKNLLPHFIDHLQIKEKKTLSLENQSHILDFSAAFNAENATNHPIRITLGLTERDLLQYYLHQTARYCSTKYNEERKDLQYFPLLLALQAHSAGITCIKLSNLSYEQLDKRNVGFINILNDVLGILLKTNPGITSIDDTNSNFRGYIDHSKSLAQANQLAAKSIELSQKISNMNKRIYDFLGIKLSKPVTTKNVLEGPNRLLLEDGQRAATTVTNEEGGLLVTIGKMFLSHLAGEPELDQEELDLEQEYLERIRFFRREEQDRKQRMAEYLINYFEHKEYLSIAVAAEYNRDDTHCQLAGFLSTLKEPADYSLMKKALKLVQQSHLELSKHSATQITPMTEDEKNQAIQRMSTRLRQGVSSAPYDERSYAAYRTKTGEIHVKIQEFFSLIPTRTQPNPSMDIVVSPEDDTKNMPRFN